jgi:type IV secretion system protein VirD4
MKTPQTATASAGAYLGLLTGAAIVALYLAGYFFLYKLGLPPYEATPLTILRYWAHYGTDPATRQWLTICTTAGVALAAAFVVPILMPVRRALHGDAQFAKISEIKEAGLLGEYGMILGKIGKKFIMLPGQLAAICAAPPRSGKGVGLVITNLLAWVGSVVVLDIRQEAFRITSGFRAKFSEVYLFNPVAEDGKTMQWNPLKYVSDDPVLRIDDLQKIANMLSPDPAEKDPFWTASCRTLFLALGLYVFETPGLPRTFGELVRQIMHSTEKTIGDHWMKIIEEREAAGTPLSSVCVSTLLDFIHTSPATQSSIRKTFTAKLELWLNPLVDAATSDDSVDLRDLRKRKISIYVGVRPGDLERLQLILNLFFQQVISLNVQEAPADNPSLKHQLMLLMDEFTALGRISIFETAFGYLGGFNLRLFIIIQSLSQLRATYKVDGANTILDCCAAIVAFAPKDQKQANEISEMLGDTTVKATSKSRRIMQAGGGSETASDHARRLLKPQEVKELGATKQIIFMENVRPIFCSKIAYYKEPVFTRRLRPPAIIPTITAHVHQRPQPTVQPPPATSYTAPVTPQTPSVPSHTSRAEPEPLR